MHKTTDHKFVQIYILYQGGAFVFDRYNYKGET